MLIRRRMTKLAKFYHVAECSGIGKRIPIAKTESPLSKISLASGKRVLPSCFCTVFNAIESAVDPKHVFARVHLCYIGVFLLATLIMYFMRFGFLLYLKRVVGHNAISFLIVLFDYYVIRKQFCDQIR